MTKHVPHGRTKNLLIRISPDELAVMRLAAEQADETLSHWLRERALAAALAELQERGEVVR